MLKHTMDHYMKMISEYPHLQFFEGKIPVELDGPYLHNNDARKQLSQFLDRQKERYGPPSVSHFGVIVLSSSPSQAVNLVNDFFLDKPPEELSSVDDIVLEALGELII